jgi:triacylglycerol esterase/lipase EstA (alpha/beta hydrolase family)
VLARLQQALTLGAIVLALAWAWWAAHAGHLLWAVAGVLAVLCGHAVVLAAEFVLLRGAHGDDHSPRAGPAQLLAAWWGEAWAAPLVFCWRQPFRSGAVPDHLPAQAQGRTGVVFIHGFVCNRGLWNPWLRKLREQGTPFVAVNLEPVFGSIDDYTAIIERAVQQLEHCTGTPPVIVAHSMGGLALRRWWAEHGGDTRVLHAITLGTPHHGTWLARFAMSPNARQMRQQSPWLQALKARELAGRAQRFTCFYSHCDNIVFPASTATLPGADNRHIPGVAHVHMADRPEPWAELQRLLAVAPAKPR